MFALLAYAFITLFAGVTLYGHVVLFRDIFSGSSSGKTEIKQIPDYRSLRKAA
jgi:hypothetical protein